VTRIQFKRDEARAFLAQTEHVLSAVPSALSSASNHGAPTSATRLNVEDARPVGRDASGRDPKFIPQFSPAREGDRRPQR
jgi:hypothetical protein